MSEFVPEDPATVELDGSAAAALKHAAHTAGAAEAGVQAELQVLLVVPTMAAS